MKNQFLIALAAAALLTACGTTESKVGMGTQLQDLPQAAQASIQQQIGSAEILDIDKEQRTGREVYEVTYQDSGGVKQKLHVAADGTILSQRQAGAKGVMHEAAGAFRGEKSSTSSQQDYQQQGAAQGEYKSSATSTQGTTASGQAELNTSTSPSVSGSYRSDSGKQSSVSAQSEDFSAGAQSSQSGAKIEGQTSSTEQSTEFSADTSAGSQDRIQAQKDVRGGAEGLLQKGSLEANEPSGAERRSESGEIKSDTSTSSSTELEANSQSAGAESIHVKFNDLPEAVQTSLRGQADESQIKSISKKTKDGKTVYEVEFKDSNKKAMCFSADGTALDKYEK